MLTNPRIAAFGCASTLYTPEMAYLPMTTIAILAMLAILAGATLSVTGFSVISSVAAQMTGDNATMSGNMTGDNVTGGNMTGSISSEDDYNGDKTNEY
jgi:xanthosine utilization system XapX-like protein